MSGHAPAASASGGGMSLGKMWEKMSKLWRPRHNEQGPSVLGAIGKVATSTRDAVMYTVGAAATLPAAAAEVALALPNNIIGQTTEIIDKVVVQPVNWVRHNVWELLTNPGHYFKSSGHGAKVAAAH